MNGKDIKLTLNSDLQYFAQQAIQSQRDKLSAEWGVIIVQDIKTGDIIAMADTNSPDPNDPGKVDAQDRGVRAVTAAYEPGSVEKMITAAALIEEGKSSPLDKFTIPPSYTVDGQTFNDSFAHGTEDRTLAGILGWSMNTGTVMAGQRLSKEQRYDWLKKFGIGEAPDIGLPAEAKGILTPARAVGRPPGVHRAVRPGRLAVHAPDRPGLPKHRQQRRDAPAAADRQLHHPRRNRGEGAGEGRRGRSSPRTPPSRSGTSSKAPSPRARSRKQRIDGYRVGAKTGTSQSPCDDGTAGFCGFTASMVGMAPMDDPRFIVEVVLQRPKGDIYGITNGPVFRSVMSQALRTYNVPPSTGEPVRLPQYAK